MHPSVAPPPPRAHPGTASGSRHILLHRGTLGKRCLPRAGKTLQNVCLSRLSDQPSLNATNKNVCVCVCVCVCVYSFVCLTHEAAVCLQEHVAIKQKAFQAAFSALSLARDCLFFCAKYQVPEDSEFYQPAYQAHPDYSEQVLRRKVKYIT